MIGRARRTDGPPTLRTMLARGHLQLVLLAVVLASLSLMVSGLFALRSYASQNVALAAETLSYAVEPALVFGDHEAARQIVQRIATNENIAAVAVDDAAGRPVVRWQREGDAGRDLGPAPPNWIGLGPVEREIAFRGTPVGRVRVTGGVRAIANYTFAALIIALCCLGITVLATRILARRLEETIAAPLDRIAEIAHDVIERRYVSRRLEPAGIAEIDRFTRDFNVLLGELESWRDSLANENAELSRRADRDPLTGLGNRARFEQAFDAALAEARATGMRVALLYCDCNGFKRVNDTYGHEAGDAVLRSVADRLREVAGDPDAVFRLGGDEFTILLAAPQVAEVAARVSAAAKQAVAAPLRLPGGTELPIGISVGAAIFPEDGQTLRQLMRIADMRMYRDKRGQLAR
ncbi:MAG: diguanylate cyclase domain-containing protein [Erythrobacter sp.]